jgi:hypothetical protein
VVRWLREGARGRGIHPSSPLVQTSVRGPDIAW